MSDKLSETILLQPGGVDAARKHEWANKARLLEQQAEKWELEAKRLYGVGQDIEEMRAALEQRVEGLKTYAMLLEGKVSLDLLDWLLRTRRLLGLEQEMANWLIPDEHREALAAEEEA